MKISEQQLLEKALLHSKIIKNLFKIYLILLKLKKLG
nr:MAG TPA: hypothetical protein [Caudoviricetes sp.]